MTQGKKFLFLQQQRDSDDDDDAGLKMIYCVPKK